MSVANDKPRRELPVTGVFAPAAPVQDPERPLFEDAYLLTMLRNADADTAHVVTELRARRRDFAALRAAADVRVDAATRAENEACAVLADDHAADADTNAADAKAAGDDDAKRAWRGIADADRELARQIRARIGR